jgi:uncharacterized membrane protein
MWSCHGSSGCSGKTVLCGQIPSFMSSLESVQVRVENKSTSTRKNATKFCKGGGKFATASTATTFATVLSAASASTGAIAAGGGIMFAAQKSNSSCWIVSFRAFLEFSIPKGALRSGRSISF